MASNIGAPAPNSWRPGTPPPPADGGGKAGAASAGKNFPGIQRREGGLAQIRQGPGDPNRVSQALSAAAHSRPGADALERLAGPGSASGKPELFARLIERSAVEPAPALASRVQARMHEALDGMRVSRRPIAHEPIRHSDKEGKA